MSSKDKCGLSELNLVDVNTLSRSFHEIRDASGHVHYMQCGAQKLRSPKAPAPIIHPKFGYMHAGLFVFESISDKNFGASPHPHTLDQLKFQVCEFSRFSPDVLAKLKQPRLLNLHQILLAVMSSDKPLPFIYQFAAGKLLPFLFNCELKLIYLIGAVAGVSEVRY